MANGAIIENTAIAVDFWRPRKYPWVKYYFLSHLHSDHTKGLTPSWRNRIYCSEVSKKLLVHKLGVREYFIQTLELNVPHRLEGDKDHAAFSVTLYDANHCPGSVMFLFEGEFGRIFYTADFRCDMMLLDNLNALKIGQIDLLYLDNTYFKKDVNFPPRSQAANDIMKVITNHPDHQIIIVIYSLGKEDLLVKIANHFHEWIIVSDEKFNMLQVLEMPNVFTRNVADGRIRVIVARDLKTKSVRDWIISAPTIAIFPTCMFNKNNNPYRNDMWTETHFIAYSDHSCYDELIKFLKVMKPKRIAPITKNRMPFHAFHDRPGNKLFCKPISHSLSETVNDSCDGATHNIDEIKDFKRRKSDEFNEKGKQTVTKPKIFLVKRIPRNKGVVFESSPIKKTELDSLHKECDIRMLDISAQSPCKSFGIADNFGFSKQNDKSKVLQEKGFVMSGTLEKGEKPIHSKKEVLMRSWQTSTITAKSDSENHDKDLFDESYTAIVEAIAEEHATKQDACHGENDASNGKCYLEVDKCTDNFSDEVAMPVKGQLLSSETSSSENSLEQCKAKKKDFENRLYLLSRARSMLVRRLVDVDSEECCEDEAVDENYDGLESSDHFEF